MPPSAPTEVVTLLLDHGDEFRGSAKNGVPHGKGTMRYTNGNSYDGDLRDGLKWGRGVFRWRNGDCYKGDFVKDVFHGHGVFTFANSALSYTGTFKSGMFTGPVPAVASTVAEAVRGASLDPANPPAQAPSPSMQHPRQSPSAGTYSNGRGPSYTDDFDDRGAGVVQLDLSAPDADGLSPNFPSLPWETD
eukprot:gene17369-26689_t